MQFNTITICAFVALTASAAPVSEPPMDKRMFKAALGETNAHRAINLVSYGKQIYDKTQQHKQEDIKPITKAKPIAKPNPIQASSLIKSEKHKAAQAKLNQFKYKSHVSNLPKPGSSIKVPKIGGSSVTTGTSQKKT